MALTSPSPTMYSQSSSEISEKYERPVITHSVVFKCIGSTKEPNYQGTLALANARIRAGERVPVRLKKEPNNPKDAKAIAFECKAADEYVRIGYIVREALDSVREAIDRNKIINVYFDYIKFVVQFRERGWYAGVVIARQGEWPSHVVRCQAKSFIS